MVNVTFLAEVITKHLMAALHKGKKEEQSEPVMGCVIGK